jgi:predicted dehydrogenase
VLVGTAGYGAVQLGLLRTFEQRGRLRLAGAVVFQPDEKLCRELEREGCAVFSTFEELLVAWPRLRVDFAVLPTPIHLHVPMGLALLRAGAHVLVEKPVAATLAGAGQLAAMAAETGRLLAVGFQYLHAPEVQALKRRLLDGGIGRLRRIAVQAAWPRGRSYYTRNAWAGRLRVGEDWVFDSPVSNAMSHFLLLMCFLAGRDLRLAAEPVSLRAELYRAQEIETFDTAVLHMETADGCRLDFYGTHSSRMVERPSLTIEGEAGSARWVQDRFAAIEGPDGLWREEARPEAHTRECMLDDVLARLRGEPAFVCDAALATVHVRCVEALREGALIRDVPEAFKERRLDQGDVYTSIRGIDAALRLAAGQGSDLRAAGMSWATPACDIALPPLPRILV